MKWEYLVMEQSHPAADDEAEAKELNSIGAAGFELVSVVAVNDSLQLYFKRPVPMPEFELILPPRADTK